MSSIRGRLMANDTDLLTSNDSNASSSSCSDGEIDRRQTSSLSLDMSSGAQDVAPVGSSAEPGEKLDSFVANGCVKLLEGTLECHESVVLTNNNATSTGVDEEVLKRAQNAVCVDSQHSTANGLVSPTADKHADQLIGHRDVHSQQATEISPNYPPTTADCATDEFSHETVSAESAQKFDIGNSHVQLVGTELTSCACSEQLSGLTPDLSNLSLVDDDSGNPTVPCNDSVTAESDSRDSKVKYIVYESERQMESIMQLITKDLSEPYSIYTYRYFIHNWPKLCFLAVDGDRCVGAIVCKLDRHKGCMKRGYIAMLAVDDEYRKLGIGSNLVVKAIRSMMDPVHGGCDEVVLETEITNSAALRLYEKLGFVRDKRLFRYYLNGVDALRLKLWLK